jgi:hypothetical protein
MASILGWQRFSLRRMFAWVAWAALVCASLANASASWLAVVSTITIGALMWAIAVVLFGHGPSRTFCQGFTLFCLGYLSVIYFILSQENDVGRIGTTWILLQIQDTLRYHWGVPYRDLFMQIGQQLWALSIGYVGGLLASHLTWRPVSAS